MIQWLTNLNSIHEDEGSIPGLTQWVRELWCKSQMPLRSCVAVGVVVWCRPTATAPILPLAWEPPGAKGMALKRPKQNKNKQKNLVYNDFYLIDLSRHLHLFFQSCGASVDQTVFLLEIDGFLTS